MPQQKRPQLETVYKFKVLFTSSQVQGYMFLFMFECLQVQNAGAFCLGGGLTLCTHSPTLPRNSTTNSCFHSPGIVQYKC